MSCNFVCKNKKIKAAILKRRLQTLNKKKENLIFAFIKNHPSQAAKMDNIEENVNLSIVPEVNLQISATTRLLQYISKN